MSRKNKHRLSMAKLELRKRHEEAKFLKENKQDKNLI